MYTQNDINKILADVNRVLNNFDERIKKLEDADNKTTKTPSTTKNAKSQENT